ncbi:MAG: C1 family peptidase [Bacillota bacterium]|nr:C1 family peptidase [Bacillota bacterium]
MVYKYNLKRDTSDPRDFRFSRSMPVHPDVVLPKSVDLKQKCPPVYDQGKLGSCTANVGCTCRAMLLDEKDINLSRLFLYYIERNFEESVKEDSGASLRDCCKSIYKIGVCEEKYMPYDEDDFKTPPSKRAVLNAFKYRISAYKLLSNLDEIKQNLALRQQPVMIGMDVYESFESHDTAKTGLMPMPGKNEKKLGGHAVLIVGYKDIVRTSGFFTKHQDKSGYLIVRNSWGDKWGDKGYFYMPYEYIPKNTYDYWIME